ncbi:MAG: hypothetical protein M3041_08270 [Acidobacteriota bacterium]|nr:hypothetical protein [Acidobacteriota bacterium]
MHVLIAAVLFAQAIGVPPQPSCNGNPSKDHPGYKTQAGWTITSTGAPKELGVEFLCKGSEGLIVLHSVVSRTAVTLRMERPSSRAHFARIAPKERSRSSRPPPSSEVEGGD